MFDEPVETAPDASVSADPAPESCPTILPSVYLDTSVPSYLTARHTCEPVALRKQRVSCLWWSAYRGHFHIYVSDRVLEEAARGNKEAAQRRIGMIAQLESLDVTEEVAPLTAAILLETGLPKHVKSDAEHVSVAAVHGVELLLTWNCRHLANPDITPKIQRACRQAGFQGPDICTPDNAIRRHVYGKRSHH